jgi:hypothetical protein
MHMMVVSCHSHSSVRSMEHRVKGCTHATFYVLVLLLQQCSAQSELNARSKKKFLPSASMIHSLVYLKSMIT